MVYIRVRFPDRAQSTKLSNNLNYYIMKKFTLYMGLNDKDTKVQVISTIARSYLRKLYVSKFSLPRSHR